MEDSYEEIYEMCQELIEPYIQCNKHGFYQITRESLIPSVVESLGYLVEFWLANRDNPSIDLCGAD